MKLTNKQLDIYYSLLPEDKIWWGLSYLISITYDMHYVEDIYEENELDEEYEAIDEQLKIEEDTIYTDSLIMNSYSTSDCYVNLIVCDDGYRYIILTSNKLSNIKQKVNLMFNNGIVLTEIFDYDVITDFELLKYTKAFEYNIFPPITIN